MFLSCLVSILAAAQPDGGVLPVTRTHQVRWVANPDPSVRLRVDVERFSLPDSGLADRTIEVLTLTLPDGGTSPALEKANAVLHGDYQGESRQVPSTASLKDGTAPFYLEVAQQHAERNGAGLLGIVVTVPFIKGRFLQVHTCTDANFAYPNVYCTDVRLRTDTGEKWSWLDGVLPTKQKAFLAACTAVLAPASRAAKAEYLKGPGGKPDEEFLEKNFPERCEDRHLNSATPMPNGDLRLDLGAPTHADPMAAWGATLPAAMLSKWAAPQGPLGAGR